MKNILKKIEIEHLYWIALFIILAFFHSCHTVNSDEGIILDGAWNLFNGRELYTEIIHYITPGSFYTIFFAWKIFGAHFFVAKLLAILFVFASAIGIKKISYEITQNKISYLSPLLFVFISFSWPIINHNSFNICFIIWALFFFIKGLKDNYSFKCLTISGFLSGIGIMFLQHKSGIILIWSTLFLFFLYIRERNKKIIKSGFSFIIASILPCLLLFKWPVKLLFEYLFLTVVTNYRVYNPTPMHLFIIVCIFVFFSIWIIRKNFKKEINFLIGVQLILLGLAWLQRPDFYHTFIILFPILALIPVVLIEIKKEDRKIKIIYSSIAAIIMIIVGLVNTINLLYFPPLSNQAKDISEKVKLYCQKDNYFYSGPFLPNFYFETRKINPSPYYMLTINSEDALSGKDNIMIRQYNEVAKILKETRPECALQSFKMMEKFNYEKNNPVDTFIEENYDVLETFGNTILYKIKE